MERQTVEQRDPSRIVRDAIARTIAIVGLGGIALIHLLDAPSKFDETPYMGWMYVGLIITCIALAAGLWHSSDTRLWIAAAALPVTVLVGFTLTRTTGLPQANGDIGDWTESLGLASLFVEGCLAALAGSIVLARRAATAANTSAAVDHRSERQTFSRAEPSRR